MNPASRHHRLAACGLVLLLAFVEATARSPVDDPIPTVRRGDLVSIFQGDLEIPEDLTVRGDVVCIGGSVRIDGRVTGDVVAVLGSVEVKGSVGGTVIGVLSPIELDNARVELGVVSILASLKLRESTVDGELVKVLGGFDRDESSRIIGPSVKIGAGAWSPDLWWLLFWIRLFQKLTIFVLLVLIVAFVPERVERVAEEAPTRFATAFLTGLLGYLGMLAIVGLLSVTIIGVPLALFAFWALKWLGIAGLFLAVGRRIGRSLGREMSVMGGVMLTFALYSVIVLAPTPLGLAGLLLIGALRVMFFLLAEVPGVGLALLTLSGRGMRPMAESLPVAADPPPAEPVERVEPVEPRPSPRDE